MLRPATKVTEPKKNSATQKQKLLTQSFQPKTKLLPKTKVTNPKQKLPTQTESYQPKLKVTNPN